MNSAGKKISKIAAIALSACMAVSVAAYLTACGGETTTEKSYVKSEHDATIVYDNRSTGYIAEKDTKYTLELEDGVSADVTLTAHTNVATYPTGWNDNGKVSISREYTEVPLNNIAKWDEETMTLTAVGEGTVTITLTASAGNVLDTVTVDITPAYVTDPQNQYDLSSSQDYNQNSSLMGWTHDPSLIEVTEEDGKKAYYAFSTGWEDGNEIRKSYDLIHWKYMGDSMNRNQSDLADIYEWLYQGGTVQKDKASWWAPDIVEAYGGGYWLYTCVVDGTDDGITLEGQSYSTACIVLFYSETLEAESFEYVGVLMQSCIPTNSGTDVNSIDPQIIYDEDGGMWMAYGSFGTGNYILELDPKTGLRKDNMYKDNKFKDWKTIREYRDEVVLLCNGYENPDEYGDCIGWETDFYGKNISSKAMEAPVIARHDNVEILDDNGNVTSTATYYYSMHSFDALGSNYSMWGGRSESVQGVYRSKNGNFVINEGVGSARRKGNQYMSAINWEDHVDNYLEPILTGHNDLFTTDNGKNIAAYITRTKSFGSGDVVFVTQMHQYYLNSKGDICINANRYSGETNRCVSEEELMAFTKNNQFKMIRLDGSGGITVKTSEYVTLNSDHTISGAATGTWSMFGDNYIKIVIDGGDTYYGVVTPAWLEDQDCFGFTITSMGQKKCYAMFMNSVSTEA